MHRRRSNGRWMLVAAPFAAGMAIAQTPPSWNHAAPEQALVGFAARVTRESSHACAKPAERIAVFDTDGALLGEQTFCFRFVFALDQIRTLAPIHSEWTKRPFKAATVDHAGALAKSGERALQEIPVASHAGIRTDELRDVAARDGATA
jgi:hypothetical protein